MSTYPLGFNPEYTEAAPSFEEIKAFKGYIILEFGTPWCGHCTAALPAIKEVFSNNLVPHVKVFDGKGKTLGRFYKVKLWPTLILIKSGEEIARLVRPVQKTEIENFIANIKK